MCSLLWHIAGQILKAGASVLGSVLGSKWTHELLLFGDGLELTVTDLGGGIDELDLQLDLREGVGWCVHGLSDGDLSLLWTHHSALKEDEVLVNDTVMWESTDWGDVLDIWVLIGRGIVGGSSDGTLTNSVDLLVEVSSVEVTLITSSGDSPLNGRWMPGTDTSDLSETSMALSWKSGDTESLDDTCVSVTSGDGNGIDHLVLAEDLTDGDFLLEVVLSHATLSATLPPLSWISMMCDFLCLNLSFSI